MASTEIFTVSSSSPCGPTMDIHTLTSSPLPLLSDFIHRLPLSESGIDVIPVPGVVRTMSTNPSSPLNKPQLDKIFGMNEIKSSKVEESHSNLTQCSNDNVNAGKLNVPKARKSKAKVNKSLDAGNTTEKESRTLRASKTDDESISVVQKVKVPRKPRAKKAVVDATNRMPEEDRASRKPRTVKMIADVQKRIPRSRVTKNIPAAGTSEKAPRGKTTVKASSKVAGQAATESEDIGLGLVEAVKRRSGWTPPKGGAGASSLASLSPERAWEGDSAERPALPSIGFSDLLGNFGFVRKELQTLKVIDDVMPKKRKRIELLTTGPLPADIKAPRDKKEKGQKKKPRTITDIATSAYTEADAAIKPGPGPIRHFFVNLDKPPSTVDRFKHTGRPKSGTSSVPILLSPQSAMKQVARQDFVFGTSSQLAREDSPTLLRDLHEAMKASNEPNSSFEDSSGSTITKSQPSSSIRPRTARNTDANLWLAASRDEGGKLLDVEMVDMADSPSMLKRRHVAVASSPCFPGDGDQDNSWHDIDDLPMQPVPQESKLIPLNADNNESKTKELDTVITGNISQAHSAPSANTSSVSEASDPLSNSPKKAITNGSKQASAMPDFASFTITRLAKELAVYHFKPIKNREAMIILLAKCWESKHGLASGRLGTGDDDQTSRANPSMADTVCPISPRACARPKMGTAADVVSPKIQAAKPRGRPRKDSVATKILSRCKPASRSKKAVVVEDLEKDTDAPFSKTRIRKKKIKEKQPLEEISDSEDFITPIPPKCQTSDTKRTSTTLSLDTKDDDSLLLSPASKQRHLFQQITQAVLLAAPTKDPNNPSWHEKILMYDPIIVENLTVWLNTGALDRVGYDGEVEPKEVKRWCEAKSICCLWKENLRGGARARY